MGRPDDAAVVRDGGETTDTAEASAAVRHGLQAAQLAQELRFRRESFESELRLRERYATWLLRLLVAELVGANAVFVAFAWAGRGWRLETEVVHGWLAATVVQVVGVVAVVTRHLFPARGRDPAEV